MTYDDDELTYDLLEEEIYNDYDNMYFNPGYLNPDFEVATLRIIEGYAYAIEQGKHNKIMIYVKLAVKGIENNALLESLEEDVIEIAEQNRLLELEDEFSESDFEKIKKDLDYVMTEIKNKK